MVGFSLANRIDLQVDGSITVQSPYGSLRGDTQGVCGDTNNGFSYLVNWSGDLGPGQAYIGCARRWSGIRSGNVYHFYVWGTVCYWIAARIVPFNGSNVTCNGKSHCKILLFGE